MTRPSLGRTAALSLTLSFIACATTEGGELVGDGDGDNPSTNSGNSTGGVVAPGSGGTSSATGSSASTGASSMGGAGTTTGGSSTTGSGGASSTGGASTATGGTTTTFEGQCSEYGSTSEVAAIGDYGVYQCGNAQAGCSGVTLNVDALFVCADADNHLNNCISQSPEGGTSWQFVALCSDLVGLGGAGGAGP